VSASSAEAGSAPSLPLGFQRAGALSALATSGRLSAVIGGKSVVVFKIDGKLVATQGLCPHLGGPICDADVQGDTLSCAWHGYNFSLRTGACEDDPDLTLERYEVRVEGDEILVKVT
jgi:nitrite reductase (NADH) small subunit